MEGPGRSCPLSYHYAPESLDRPAEIHATTLYVVGGLYGNQQALAQLLLLAAAEPEPTRIVFNGDFNWFNSDDDSFRAINQTVLQHLATRGNVETELAHGDEGAGCGCAYPDEVSDDEVARSNFILDCLRAVAQRQPALAGALAALPMTVVAQVGSARVAIVHGDAESLAGWGFGCAALGSSAGSMYAESLLTRARVDLIASSHTCLPVLARLHNGVIVNNGAAGMPNFRGTRYGVFTRISLTPARKELRCYGTKLQDVFVDALRLEYAHEDFVREFFRRWPAGSAAYASYYQRIIAGPNYGIDQALSDEPPFQRKARVA